MINELLMRLIRKNKECTKTNIRNAKEHIATDPKHIQMIWGCCEQLNANVFEHVDEISNLEKYSVPK